MTLVELWLSLLLAFSEGRQCEVGTRIVDWYDYWPQHTPVAMWLLDYETGSQRQQVHLFEDGAGEQFVFFYDPANMPHGTCAVVLPVEMRYVHD